MVVDYLVSYVECGVRSNIETWFVRKLWAMRKIIGYIIHYKITKCSSLSEHSIGDEINIYQEHSISDVDKYLSSLKDSYRWWSWATSSTNNRVN